MSNNHTGKTCWIDGRPCASNCQAYSHSMRYNESYCKLLDNLIATLQRLSWK